MSDVAVPGEVSGRQSVRAGNKANRAAQYEKQARPHREDARAVKQGKRPARAQAQAESAAARSQSVELSRQVLVDEFQGHHVSSTGNGGGKAGKRDDDAGDFPSIPLQFGKRDGSVTGALETTQIYDWQAELPMDERKKAKAPTLEGGGRGDRPNHSDAAARVAAEAEQVPALLAKLAPGDAVEVFDGSDGKHHARALIRVTANGVDPDGTHSSNAAVWAIEWETEDLWKLTTASESDIRE